MMITHIVIFSIYLFISIPQIVVYNSYIFGFFNWTYFQLAMTGDSLFLAAIFSYFLLNQFIAYLMLQFSNPANSSQELFTKILAV